MKGLYNLKEGLLENNFLKEINFLSNLVNYQNKNKLSVKFVEILRYNYTLEIFEIDFPPKSLENILLRNKCLHRFIFYNFNHFDLFFKFLKN
jgi:hypothetical protein